MQEKKIPKALYLLPVLCLIIFGWLGTQLYRDAFAAFSSRSWPTASGTVIRSEWKHYGGKGCHYGLILRYSYVVDGATYVGGNYRFGGECDDSVMQVVGEHPVGSTLRVHYKPEAPDQSVIAAGELSGNTKFGLVLVPFMMLLGIFLFLMVRRRS